MKSQPTLGTVLRNLRSRHGWTLKEMSAKIGIPVSTLSKVEHDRLTLTYDKLQQLSRKLSIRMSDLFVEDEDTREPQVTARRSIGRLDKAFHIDTPNYDYYFLCTELRRKLMIPIVTRIRARTLGEFGDLVRHPGEEIIYVLEGRIEVHTDFYDAVTLEKGEAIYIDSTMGHAYLAGEGCDEALVLGVCSSVDDGLLTTLMNSRGETGL